MVFLLSNMNIHKHLKIIIMNRILTEKINKDLTRIIGIYLLPSFKLLDTKYLNYTISCIKSRLNSHNILITDNDSIHNTEYCKNFNNCKIFYFKKLDIWSIRMKN